MLRGGKWCGKIKKENIDKCKGVMSSNCVGCGVGLEDSWCFKKVALFALLRRWCFNRDVKEVRNVAVLILGGRAFQAERGATAKTQKPKHFLDCLRQSRGEWARVSVAEERRAGPGAWLCADLKTSLAIGRTRCSRWEKWEASVKFPAQCYPWCTWILDTLWMLSQQKLRKMQNCLYYLWKP